MSFSLSLAVRPERKIITGERTTDELNFESLIQLGHYTARDLTFNLMVDQCGCSFTTPININSTQAIAMGVLSRLNGRLLLNASDFSLSYHPLEDETRICFIVHVRNFKFRDGSRIPKQNFRASALINVSIVGEWAHWTAAENILQWSSCC